MAKGNCIIVTADPKGRFEECFISGTPKPGTAMEIKLGVAAKGGRWTMEAAGTTAANSTLSGMAADGNRIPIAILLGGCDPHAAVPPGGLSTDAYVDGQRGVVYYPVPGEEMNVLLMDISGTGADQDFVVGTKLIVDDGTGKFLSSSSTPEAEPFVCLEAVSDLAADQLVWAYFTGY
jgi:hypothetical protein